MRRFNRALAAGAVVAAATSPASALTISTGLTITGITLEAAPATAVGGGTLEDLAAKAADVWEAALGDHGAETVVNLGVAWADTPTLTGSATSLAVAFGQPFGPAIIGTTSSKGILFNSKRNDWFVDATPYDPSEFAARSVSSVDVGGAPLETSDSFLAAVGSPARGRFDAFTVMLHEIGHAIGFGDYLDSPFDVGMTEIGAPLPFAGYMVPLTTTGGGHIAGSFNTALLYPFIGAGRRSLASELDLITVAEVVGYRVKDLDAPGRIAGLVAEAPAPAPVPLPATALLTVAGIAGLAGAARRRRAA